MEDRYLFKAKRLDNGEWVQGALLDGEIYCLIAQEIKFSPYIMHECKIVGYEVDRDTICQCTGLKDKNGKLIWENDIVEILSKDGRFVIEWSDTEAKWQMHNFEEGYTVDFDNYWSHEVEVISNKFNNPELLESEETI